jgi:hypothetical protein
MGRKKMNRKLGERRGTAEIVGTLLFLVILFFILSNVFLWHDNVSNQMDSLMGDKMNSRVELTNNGGVLWANATGGKDVRLIRIWITSDADPTLRHIPIDLETDTSPGVLVRAGSSADITELVKNKLEENNNPAGDYFVKILTDLGNTATARYRYS